RVVADRAEGVHGDDDADRGEQTGTGQRHGEQGDGAADQVGAEHGGGDDHRGVDGRLETDGDTGQHDGGRTGLGGLADGLDRLVLGAGEVAGEPQDDAGEHDADDHRDGGDDGRVALRTGEVGGQEDERGRRAQHGRDDGRDVERAVDGDQAVLAGAGLGDVHTDDRGDDPDGGHDQREDQAVRAERDRAEDQRRDQRHRVGLEQVGGHTGAVTDVVTHVVGDGRRVPRVVLRDVLLDLADQVRADVSGLGEDAATNTHEHRDQRGAETEALQHLGGLARIDQHHQRGAEQAEPDGDHADGAAGAERDPHGLLPATGLPRRRGHPQVGLRGQPHAEVADGEREAGADQEEQRAADALAPVLRREEEQQYEHHGAENDQGVALPLEVGNRAFLHGLGDLLHLRGALTGGQNLLEQDVTNTERGKGDHCDHGHDAVVASGQRNAVRED